MCSPECPTLEPMIDEVRAQIEKKKWSKINHIFFILQKQLMYRLVKLRLKVLRTNFGKLLCICVREKEKWQEFGWVGKTVDEILDDLMK